jgi:Domain of unknown function (DUF4375)
VASADLWDLYSEFAEQDRSSLSDAQQAVFAICDLRQEVNSGGFDSYFRYRGGDTAPVALAVLPDLLGQDWADLLLDAMDTLGSTYPAGAAARTEALDAQDRGAELSALDDRFYELEAAVDADLRLDTHFRDDGGS